MLHYAGPTRTELFDDPPDETCWQKAARDVQGMSNDSSKIQIQEGAQAEVGGVSGEVVSGSQYNASFGLIGRDEGTHYIVRSGDTVYLLSCSRQWRWEAKCPVLAAGEKFTLAIDAKNQVHLTGARGGKPVDIKLEYERSEQLPSRASGASAGQPANAVASADPETATLSDSGKAFLGYCGTEGERVSDKIANAACKLWVDGFLSGLAVGMAAATPGESEFDLEKNDIVCLTKTATFGQVFPLILKYIRDHPADREEPTAALAFAALQEAFPCKR